MRMGSPKKKKSRSSRKKDSVSSSPSSARPKYSSRGLKVGVVSSNLISSIYMPTILDNANDRLEQYAGALVEYEDWLQQQAEVETAPDGTTETTMDPPLLPLFHSQAAIDDFTVTLEEMSIFFGEENGWKIHANAAKFERRLDEKYGRFRPFITNHPEVERAIRSLQRKYAMGALSPFRQSDPPLSKTTSIILLFMMQRNGVRWEILLLTILFLLVGLQPWALVTLAALVHSQFQKRKRDVVGTMKSTIQPVKPYYDHCQLNKERLALLKRPVGTPLGQEDISKYDTLVLGGSGGPAALYTAALLSRAGRKVLVLTESNDASGCQTLTVEGDWSTVPFDVDSTNVSRLNRIQTMLAPALCTTSDLQGGIRFAEIGSTRDGYAFEILDIPGLRQPFLLRAGGGSLASLMEDTASYLGDGWPGPEGEIGGSTAGTYLAACTAVNATASEYYLSKVLPESASALRNASTYQNMALRYAANLLDRYLPLNAPVRSLMAGMGMKSECIKPNQTSAAAHVTNICSVMSEEGMHYPVGGPRALSHALATVVEQCGGKLLTGVKIKELMFAPEEQQPGQDDDKAVIKPPRCIGVQLLDGRELELTSNEEVSPTIVSLEGFIATYIRYLPDSIRTRHKVPRGLPALTEQRPVFKILFALDGSAEELSVTGADYYRLPQASLAFDEVDPDSGAVKLGVVGGSDDAEEEAVEPSVDDKKSLSSDTDVTTEAPRKKRTRRAKKFDCGISWIHISFPSAKDPSFAACHGKLSTCVVTIEADDDFVTLFDTKPKIFSIHKENHSERSRLLERVRRDLLETYPQLEGKIKHTHLVGPLPRGLSHNPERYAAKGVRADSLYPGLFNGGSDLTVGESFAGSIVGGWLAANAVMGYSVIDHTYLQKNITSDLEQFMDPPEEEEEESLAVPFEEDYPHAAASVIDKEETVEKKNS